MSDEIIKIQNLVKKFRIYHDKKNTLSENLLTSKKNNHFEDLVVIDGVSFNVKKGEMLGLIGRNGSGKTTLLRLIANIYKPDSGTITTNGSIVPLLELGTGFQGELSAKDNIIQYGVILGFTKKEISQKVNDILKFAELEKFADTKTRNFSSGMIARLAFSTAIQINPDILLIDEVLAVGDLSFQQKSFEKFLELKKNKTIVYVTHNVDAVKQLCDRGVLLDKGKIVKIGDPEEVVNAYLNLLSENK
jgi:ABC-type polysaccharide/polyol phosphate transport system ATPase subunit